MAEIFFILAETETETEISVGPYLGVDVLTKKPLKRLRPTRSATRGISERTAFEVTRDRVIPEEGFSIQLSSGRSRGHQLV